MRRLVCMFSGHRWLPFPADVWEPLRCRRCGFTIFTTPSPSTNSREPE